MRRTMKKPRRSSRWAALRDESGSVSVEFALWVPVIVVILVLVADASAAFLAQASMWQSAGDVSRALATGRVTEAQAQQFISDNTALTMQVNWLDDVVVVQLSRPFSGIGTGLALSFVGDLQVQIAQHIEEGVGP